MKEIEILFVREVNESGLIQYKPDIHIFIYTRAGKISTNLLIL